MKMQDETMLKKLVLRTPTLEDGDALNKLVAKHSLNKNSVYCNLLQCTQFAATSVAASLNNRLVGFISAFPSPADPKTLFVWQIVVDEMVRGHGIAKKMLNRLVDLPNCKNALTLNTTVTLDNGPLRALFESFARDCGADLIKSILFKRDAHLSQDEYLYCVSPLPNRQNEFNAHPANGMVQRLRLSSTKRWFD